MNLPTLSEAYSRLHAAVNTRLQSVGGGRLVPHLHPTVIAIGMTERCNARCVHCNIWKKKGKEEVVPLEDWKRALRELRDWLGPVHISITGGEALLRSHTVDVVAYGSSIGLLIEHLTHGYWRDQSRIEGLARARPWRITMSLDGIGEAHDKVRGRKGFFEATMTSLDTIERVGRETGKRVPIRFKTVVMRHNMHDVANVARFARQRGYEVFYQPIEQNYASDEDAEWYRASDNWPTDTDAAVRAVEELIALKKEGYPIANPMPLLEGMIAYFRDPDAHRVAVQRHANLEQPACSAMSNLQISGNGDMLGCYTRPAFGNIRAGSIREQWIARPAYWRGGCCMNDVPASAPVDTPAREKVLAAS